MRVSLRKIGLTSLFKEVTLQGTNTDFLRGLGHLVDFLGLESVVLVGASRAILVGIFVAV